MALHHAPKTDDGPARAAFLEATRLDQRVDRLLLGGVNEATRVDDDDLGLLEVGRKLGTTVRELSDVSLAVDCVLVAAEGEERELQRIYWPRCWMLGSSC